MAENKDSWADYSKLVLKELERLNENHEKMRSDFDSRLNEMSLKLNDVKGIEKTVNQNSEWIQKVNDIWSPIQMKEAKDELYKQKNRWVAVIAIMSFIQIVMGVILSLWGKI
jgi:polyhydroxyalkanoate synthesis regulator protein